jgi:CBS domain-containing protein
MKIRDILLKKGTEVICVGSEQPVLAAVKILSEHRIGALVVRSGDDIRGIISERDVLNLLARGPEGVRDARVEDVMTSDLIVGVPGDDIEYVMSIMTKNRIRHLPVVTDGRLDGILSIGDVVNAVKQSVESENRHLKDYIHGVAR